MRIRRSLYLVAGAAVAAEVVTYLLWRPRMLRWGATAEEATEPLPGDDHTPHPRLQTTHAVTIDAPPEQVWPWLMQMGIGRAGFYTHDWVERLMFRARYAEGRRSATRIHPELPPLNVGDTVPMGAGVFAPVSEAEPCRHGIRVTGRSRRQPWRRAGAAAHPVRGPVHPRRGPGCPRAGLLRRRPAAPLYGDRDAHRDQGTCGRERAPMPITLTGRPPPWGPWRPRPDAAPPTVAARPRPAAVAAIKTIHTLAWVSIESCVLYLLYAGFAGHTGKRAGIAGAVVAAETLIFAGNGFRCPLTKLAERYGAQSGSVTDIYLPKWLAHNMPAIHTPLLALMTYLHVRNLRRSRSTAYQI